MIIKNQNKFMQKNLEIKGNAHKTLILFIKKI